MTIESPHRFLVARRWRTALQPILGDVVAGSAPIMTGRPATLLQRSAVGQSAGEPASPGATAKVGGALVGFDLPDQPVGGLTKRVFDIALSCAALVLLCPIMLAIAVLIRITSAGPLIFRQTRVGFGGRPFTCYKFRTMVIDAEAELQTYLGANPDAAQQWRDAQKLSHDPRVTRLGQLLRKSSLDELPQFVNVFKGDMSCVGPRPVLPDELRRYGADAAHYIQARPGITGKWQTSGRNRCTYAKRVALDTDYVLNWSLNRDVVILARTIPAALEGDKTH